MPRVHTTAHQRRGRCLADTDLMTRSSLSEASIGVVASPSATSIRAPTSGLSRSSGESRPRCGLPAAAAQDRRRIRQFQTTLQKAQVHTSDVGSQRQDRVGGAARRPETDHQEVRTDDDDAAHRFTIRGEADDGSVRLWRHRTRVSCRHGSPCRRWRDVDDTAAGVDHHGNGEVASQHRHDQVQIDTSPPLPPLRITAGREAIHRHCSPTRAASRDRPPAS
jgi:hypothetical protein